ncbi:MAG: polyprenyl synthetase family protein [Chloroflexi bacterium]|nr:polyprenyl synthetase family protein [Chloroflexota bacterium]
MNKTVSFIASVQDELREVEDLMRRQAEGYHPDIRAAMDLLISAGGKRVRPALTILAGKMLGAPPDALLSIATAIEMLHTATLVHDDLIDGSLLRRGMPTLNAKWSPGATVLTGDFIFARAAKLAAETNSVPVMKLFSKTLTVIVEGEIAQLLGSRCTADRESYYKRIYAKTASLFETSAWAAAMVSNADEQTAEAARRYGYEIGMAFQIIDDILDFVGDQNTIGKPVGGDLRQGIVTLPALHYVETHPNDSYAQLLRDGECMNNDQIDCLLTAIRDSDAIQRSHAEAEQYVARGLENLRSLPACAERYALEELAEYIVDRKF